MTSSRCGIRAILELADTFEFPFRCRTKKSPPWILIRPAPFRMRTASVRRRCARTRRRRSPTSDPLEPVPRARQAPWRNRRGPVPAPRAGRPAAAPRLWLLERCHRLGPRGLRPPRHAVVERHFQHLGGRSRVLAHIGGNALGLGIDVDDVRLGQHRSGAQSEPGLCATAARAVHDGPRREAQGRTLRGDLQQRTDVAYCAQGTRHAIRHDVGSPAKRAQIVGQSGYGPVAISSPRHGVQAGAVQAGEQRIAR